MKEDFGILNIFRQIKFKHDFRSNNPGYFNPDGLLVFVGPQGSGKTLSSVNYVYKLLEMYPKCKLVSNIELSDYPIVSFEDFLKKYLKENELQKEDYNFISDFEDYVYLKYLKENRVFLFEEAKDLVRYKNSIYGVIFLIDEIQLYFNSLGSKNIDIDVMTQISQQRKQRIHIVATSQVFGRMSKQLREQFDVVIYCEKKFFGLMQKNNLIDRNSIDSEESTGTNLKGTVKKVYRFFRSPKSFLRYDTYKVIENKNLNVESKGVNLYDGSRLSNNR